MSSIARAFTTRRVKMSVELAHEARERAAIQRSNTTMPSTKPGGPIRPELENDSDRPKISGPVELLHTTNMLSYNAPDLPRPSTSSQASTNTDNDSDSAPGTALSSPPTSPDVAPSELKAPPSPEPNHLSPYFGAPRQAPTTPIQASAPAPAIPQRAPSRSRQASVDAMPRQRSTGRLQKKNGRSMSRTNGSVSSSANSITAPSLSRSNGSVSSSTNSVTASSMSRSNGSVSNPMNSVTTTSMPHRSAQSQTSIGSAISAPMPPPVAGMPQAKPHPTSQTPSHHPFESELAKVNEMAEEFGVNDKKSDAFEEEERELISRGLRKFSADVYLHDIEVLTAMFFHEKDFRHSRPAPALWI